MDNSIFYKFEKPLTSGCSRVEIMGSPVLKKNGQPLAAGDVKAGQIVKLIYNSDGSPSHFEPVMGNRKQRRSKK